MIRWLLIYYGLWMSIVCDLMGHCSAQWRVKINSVCLSRTRFIIRGNFRHHILIAGLQLSSYRSLEILIYRLLSVDVCLASIINHLSVHLYSSLPCLHWWLVDGCCLLAPHLSGVAVGHRNFAAAVCDACGHPSPCSVAGTGLLMMTWCRLLPVFVTIDKGCDCCHASASWTSVLSSLCYWFDHCS